MRRERGRRERGDWWRIGVGWMLLELEGEGEGEVSTMCSSGSDKEVVVELGMRNFRMTGLLVECQARYLISCTSICHSEIFIYCGSD